jgi:outer membrane protein OmpA-like peptidoglycan-associated protein
MKYIVLYILSIIILVSPLLAQDSVQNQSYIYIDSTGQVYTKADAPAYLFIAPANAPEKLTIVPSNDKEANPMSWDGHGSHHIVHRDNERNISTRFIILADGIAPITKLSFESGLFFHIDNSFFADKNSLISFRAKDEMSGVKESYYSVNDAPFTLYTQPISVNAEGEFKLRVYSVDNVGNKEEPKEFALFTSEDAVVRMDNIYFDLNSTKLRPQGVAELNKLANLLKNYPDIYLEIRAHSDAQGNAKYNLSLSEGRAQAAVAYLMSRGIKKERLSAKGYGDTMLLNECAQGVQCTEEQHKVNRRIELVVSKISNK